MTAVIVATTTIMAGERDTDNDDEMDDYGEDSEGDDDNQPGHHPHIR